MITQQAIWSYIEGWPIDSSDGSIRTRYIKDLLQAAENQTPQEHPVLLSPESPSFRLQGGFYRSETLTLTQADGSIAIHPENGMLTKVGYQLTGIHPRNFIITPNGKYLLVACRDSNVIQVYERDTDTGLLTDIRKDIKVDKPVCIKFVS